MITQRKDTHTYEARIELSGTLPRNGFLTFPANCPASTDELTPDDPNDTEFLPNEGACLSIFTGPTTSIFTMKYGNAVCDTGVDPTDATGVSLNQGESLNAQLTWNPDAVPPSATWVADPGPSKGWCDSDVDSNCPNIGDEIVQNVQNENVNTNLGDMDDLSRISGLYFENTNRGKILFNKEINFTDKDAMTWMETLHQNIELSTSGEITMDATLIQNLIDTEATLTMYGLSLNNPKILVDGQEDTEGIVSGLSYDSSSGELTFTAAHFTTFKAVEQDSSAAATAEATATSGSCSDWPPSNAPKLFEIRTTMNSAKLFFTPVNDYLSDYLVFYGPESNKQAYSGIFPAELSTGVETAEIGYLNSGKKYHFKVRGANGCAAGPWSNEMAAVTETTSTESGFESQDEDSGDTTKSLKPSPSPTTTKADREVSPQPTPYPTKPSTDETEQTKVGFWQQVANFFRELL